MQKQLSLSAVTLGWPSGSIVLLLRYCDNVNCMKLYGVKNDPNGSSLQNNNKLIDPQGHGPQGSHNFDMVPLWKMLS